MWTSLSEGGWEWVNGEVNGAREKKSVVKKEALDSFFSSVADQNIFS